MDINIDEYKQRILEAGFEEASKRPLYFWKILTDKTAFIINLKTLSVGVGVVYGVISTAVFWTDDDWRFFKQRGQDDADCNLRFYREIRSELDETQTHNAIEKLYKQYLYIDKEALLATVREYRKQFIQQITNVLKPLGFRKKGNQWRIPLSENIMLQFWADKDPYSDLYYFEANIYAMTQPDSPWCYTKRLHAKGTDVFDWKYYSTPNCRFDWQLQSTEDLLEIVNRAYEEELRPFIENGIEEMGKQPFVWQRCICNRKCCLDCWVEKNVWEAKESE